MLSCGAVINDRYEITKDLGGGAQGRVFEVSDKLYPSRPTALKVLGDTLPQTRARFEYEFGRLARLEHPHLVRVYDFGTIISATPTRDKRLIGATFFTQELVSGLPAHKWALGLDETVKERLIASVALGVARALGMLHSRGLLHRDVKPSNILVDAEADSVKLIDLGLSVESRILDGLKAGTFGYMAPESLAGLANETSDIYSLGVTLMELFSGEPPVWGKVPSDAPPAGVSRDMWSLTTKLTAKNLDERPASATEVSLAIGRILGAELLSEGREGELLDATSDADNLDIRSARVRSVSFIGRTKELTSLVNWLKKNLLITPASGRLAIVTGLAGIGKTRLIDSALTILQMQAARDMKTPLTIIRGTIEEIGATTGCFNDGLKPGVEALFKGVAACLSKRKQPTVLHLTGDTLDSNAEYISLLTSSYGDEEFHLTVVVEMNNLIAAKGLFEAEDDLFIDLKPLSKKETSEYAAQIIGKTPSDNLLSELLIKTSAIPLLIESVFEILPNGGASLREDYSLSKLELPSEKEALITLGFLARLNEKEKNLVAAAAVLRRPCSRDEIGALAQITNNSELLGYIGNMVDSSLLCLKPNGDLELALFTKKSIIGQIDPAHLISMNRTAFENEFNKKTPDAALLAAYSLNGQLPEEAHKYAVSASLEAEREGNLLAASEQLETLINSDTYLDDPALSLKLAGLYRRTGRYKDALSLLSTLSKGDKKLSDKAKLELFATWRLSGRTEEAQRGLEGLLESKDPSVSAEAKALMARMYLDTGDIKGALKELEGFESVPGQTAVRSGLLGIAGLVFFSKGDTDKAKKIFEKGLMASDKLNEPRHHGKFAALAGMTAHGDGRFQDAAKLFEKALEIAIQVGDRHGAAIYAGNIAAALTEVDDFEGALSKYREGRSRLRAIGRFSELTQTGANYAQLLLRLGDIKGAKHAADLSLADANRSDDPASKGIALNIRGDVLLGNGMSKEALDQLLEAEQILLDAGQTTTLAACRLNIVNACLAQDKIEEAQVWYEAIRAISDSEHDNPAVLAAALELQLKDNGDPQEILKKLIRALPGPSEKIGLLDVGLLGRAAIAAKEMGRRQLATNLATATIRANQKLNASIPRLHRDTRGALEIKMKEILGDHDYENLISSTKNATPTLSNVGWRRLARINTRLNSEHRIGALLDLIMDTALDVTEAQRGFLLVKDEGGKLNVRSAQNMDKEKLSSDDRDYSRSVAERAYSSGTPVMTTNAQEDDLFKGYGSVVSLELQYIIAVPLLVQGKATGTIYVDSKMGGKFDDERLKILQALADQAAIALTNARLVDSAQRKQREIESLNARLKEQLQERDGELTRAKRDLDIRTDDLSSRYHFAGIIGRGNKMSEIFKLIDLVKDTDMPVVIGGETGTGKELAARAIHYSGERKKGAFVAENCGAIPSQLLESELFGHVKGAFTGAIRDKAGLFVEANGGTLFLDEIGDMPLEMQTKMLRVLQDGNVRPVGGGKTISVNVRILVASNKKLQQLVKEKQFREDLFYRLNVIELVLPPLRERREDIPLLIEHFVSKHARGDLTPRVSNEALEVLMNYSWPGNVRQLENEIMRALVLSEAEILPENLSETILGGSIDILEELSDYNVDHHVDRLKQRLVRTALKKSSGNKTKAATMLGLSRYGLQKMLARWEI